MQSLSIAATGMMAQQLNVEVISNNIANMSTSGFKRQRAEFQDLLYQNLRRVGTNSSDAGTIVPAGVQVGLGVKTAAVNRIMTQGNLDNTENKLDIAIQGRGWFRVELPSGEDAYTRSGSLTPRPTSRPRYQYPARGDRRHHQPRRSGSGDPAGRDRLAGSRPDRTGDLPERCRP